MHQQEEQRQSPYTSGSSMNPTYLNKAFEETEKFIIFREKTTTSEVEQIVSESLANKDEVYQIFFRRHTCYDLIPNSSKLVVFDTELNVKKAFFALLYNGVRAAHLWDASQQAYVGMITITDFIKVLHHFHNLGCTQPDEGEATIDQLEHHKISTWREMIGQDYKRPLITIYPESTLEEAIQCLLSSKVHRLPIIDKKSGNPLHILTHKRILKFLYLNLGKLPSPGFNSETLMSLKIGTYENISTIHEDTPLSTAIQIFIQKTVSALPVVNSEGVLVDIYAKFDVINLAATKSYHDLEVSVSQALQDRKKFQVETCSKHDTFEAVLHKIVTAEVHRLVMVDKDGKVEGIVSLSDILTFIQSREVPDHSSPMDMEL